MKEYITAAYEEALHGDTNTYEEPLAEPNGINRETCAQVADIITPILKAAFDIAVIRNKQISNQ